MSLGETSISLENNNSQRVNFLIALFDQGTISPIQHEELVELLALPENKALADQFLTKVWENTDTTSKFFSFSQTERMHNALSTKITEKPIPLRKLNTKLIQIIAAAAILVLVFSYLIYQQHDLNHSAIVDANTKKTEPLLMDVSPGGNKATLTLANNRVILLDTVKNGRVVNIGNLTLKKNGDGQLIFKVNPTAPNAGKELTGNNTLSTPIGGQYQVILADGSHVWLNASSSLKFPSTFAKEERSVSLEGEGYFEISKLKGKPFIVNTRDMNVEVLGTHFNINAYANEPQSATTLIEGSVKVSNNLNSALLVPNEQAKIKNGQFKVKQIDVEDVLAWKKGYFVFDKEEIHSVMRKLERWYNIKVEYQDPNIDDQFVGTISKFKNISEILKLLQATGTINFKILPSQDPRYERRVVVMK